MQNNTKFIKFKIKYKTQPTQNIEQFQKSQVASGYLGGFSLYNSIKDFLNSENYLGL